MAMQLGYWKHQLAYLQERAAAQRAVLVPLEPAAFDLACTHIREWENQIQYALDKIAFLSAPSV
ncbi:MAG: hypothetical protein WC551_08895 [Patescibacteria group bacterium]